MQKPPFSFEEFLQSQNLKEWPKFLFLDEPYSLVDELQKDYSFDAVSKYLHENVPLNISPLLDLEERINAYVTELQEHAGKIFSLQHGPAYLKEHLIPLGQTIADEQSDAEGVLKSEMGKAEVAQYTVDESKCRNIESYNYPGFNVKQHLHLPRHLEAPKLWDLIIKAQHFKKDVLKVWRSLFLSKSSIAVFQDSFWWWFLQKFKPNQEDQDHLFDRIADSFVALFLLVPKDTKDAFFQVYPDCLSQVIYVAFCEAFPESIKCFDDDFKDELVDLIFQWISGLKPNKCTWRKWNLNSFKTTVVNDTSGDAPTNVQVSGSAGSLEAWRTLLHSMSAPERLEIAPDFIQQVQNMNCEDLLEDVRYMADGEKSEDSGLTNDMTKESGTVKESCYIGPDPECRRVLFRLGGQSPLVSYYLKMHEIPNAASYSLTCRINHTEVYKLPPVAPTYQDVIKETRRLREEFQKDYTELQQKYEKDIEAIRKERKEINHKFKRQIKASRNPADLKFHTAIVMKELDSKSKRYPEAEVNKH